MVVYIKIIVPSQHQLLVLKRNFRISLFSTRWTTRAESESITIQFKVHMRPRHEEGWDWERVRIRLEDHKPNESMTSQGIVQRLMGTGGFKVRSP